MNPSASATCPKCGAVLPADAPAGLCPQCLLAAGLASQSRPAGNPPAAESTAGYAESRGRSRSRAVAAPPSRR